MHYKEGVPNIILGAFELSKQWLGSLLARIILYDLRVLLTGKKQPINH
jgi:hypothetical protein